MSPDKKSNVISISELNLVDQCSEAVEMPFLDTTGEETGITFLVLGAHAEEIQRWTNKKLNARRRQEEMLKKRGKSSDIRPIEEDIDFGTELIARRLVGWTGIKEEWTPDLALQLCTCNPLAVEQIREFSEDLGNFGKSK